MLKPHSSHSSKNSENPPIRIIFTLCFLRSIHITFNKPCIHRQIRVDSTYWSVRGRSTKYSLKLENLCDWPGNERWLCPPLMDLIAQSILLISIHAFDYNRKHIVGHKALMLSKGTMILWLSFRASRYHFRA
jgi:hypothetical protein